MRHAIALVPLLALLAACGDDEEETTTSPASSPVESPKGGTGIGLVPGSELTEVLESLPLYEGAEVRHPGTTTESAVMSAYVVKGAQEPVLQFYREALLAAAWEAEEPASLSQDSRQHFAVNDSMISFLKDDLRAAILVWPNEKNPSDTLLDVIVERGK
jgi:hypothetical protein